MHSFASALVVAAIVALCLPLPARAGAQATNAASLFREARTRETAIRQEIDARRTPAARGALLDRARTLVNAYDDIARLFPKDRYADDAIWQGATLAADVFWEFGETADRDTALRLLKTLATRYPSSTFAAQVTGQRTRLDAAPPQATALPAPPPTIPRSVPNAPQARLTSIRREVMPGALRLVVELDAETAFHDTQLDAPTRLLLDLHNAQPIATLRNATRTFQDDVVRRIQVMGIAGTTRLAFDLSGNTPHTTYALYNPYRVVIDFAREATAAQLAQIARPARAESASPPQPNTRGGFSLSRQLGLGVARVVIDPGHGGHDPGAMSGG